jgi:hypothetical protein
MSLQADLRRDAQNYSIPVDVRSNMVAAADRIDELEALRRPEARKDRILYVVLPLLYVAVAIILFTLAGYR